ncbi:MAG: hypothetical protein EOO07_07245 [Chitinophagaceae bacterium]|nr:MAG: hypothetical protein EOO07_07245 [Chitinophagaceae bacterium]
MAADLIFTQSAKNMQPKTTKFFLFSWAPTALLVIFLLPATLFAQSDPAYKEAKQRLLNTLQKNYVDDTFAQHITKFYGKTADSLLEKNSMIESRSILVILTRLYTATNEKLNNRSISTLRIPAVNQYFLETLREYKKQPISTLYREIAISQSSILDYAFDGTSIGDSIHLVVSIREMLNSPYFISTRLGNEMYKPYRDTMLYFLANTAPEILSEKLTRNDALFTSLVKNSDNKTVKAVTAFEKDVYYEKMLPFGLAIQEKRFTADSIRKLSLTPSAYYRAFIDETLHLYSSDNRLVKTHLEKPIEELNKTLATKFYIDEINMLHESPDNVRFKILESLSPRELYFLLVGGTGQLYTSSFLHVYKKLMAATEKEGLEKFLTSIHYYQFGQFVTNVSVYGLVDDLVEKLSPAKFAGLMATHFRKVLSTQLTDTEVILNAMTIAEIFHEFRRQPELQKILLSQIALLENSKLQKDVMLQRLFAGFKNILQNKNDYTSDARYDVLPVKKLQRNGDIVQAHFFYDDEDGTSSFESSMHSYDKKNWEKKDMGNYILLSSLSGNSMKVFMNKPMTKPGSDSAQDEMLRDIADQGYEITSFIHRGHSYHLYQSLRKIKPSCEFVFLGSCGGYSEALNVFELNPDVNIIVTRNIGSKLINDPLLQYVNQELVAGNGVNWNAAWAHFDGKFTSRQTKDLFSSYLPPNKFIGVKFIRKVLSF